MALMEILVYDYHAQAGDQVRAQRAYTAGEKQATFMAQGLQEHCFRKPLGSIIHLLRLRVHIVC